MDGGQVGGLSQASLSGGNGNGVNINNTNAEYSSKVSPAVSVATVNTVSSKASASSKGNPAGNSAPQNGAATGQAGTPAAANLMMTLNTSLAALQNKLNLQQQQQQSGPGGNRKGGVAAKGIVLENAASAIVSGGGNSNSGGGGAGGASSSSPSGGGGSGSGLPGGPQQPMSGSKQPYLLCDLSERYFQQQQATRTAEAHNISRSLDESKSLLLMNLIESIIKSYVARSMADEALMESCIQQLLPTCALTREVVEFLASWLANDGGAAKFFHPGVHEWMRKIGNFIQKTRKVA